MWRCRGTRSDPMDISSTVTPWPQGRNTTSWCRRRLRSPRQMEGGAAGNTGGRVRGRAPGFWRCCPHWRCEGCLGNGPRPRAACHPHLLQAKGVVGPAHECPERGSATNWPGKRLRSLRRPDSVLVAVHRLRSLRHPDSVLLAAHRLRSLLVAVHCWLLRTALGRCVTGAAGWRGEGGRALAPRR